MNILILGGTRFIGKEVVNNLKNMNLNITVFSRNFENNDRVTQIIGDRNNEGDIKSIKGNFDVIVDFISYNSKHTKDILNLFPYSKYILISTAWKEIAYRNKYKIKYNYIKNKRLAETVLIKNNSSKKNIIIRLPIILGSNDHTNRTNFFRQKKDAKSKIIYLTEPDLDIFFCWKSEVSKFIVSNVLTKKQNIPLITYPPDYFNIKLSEFIKIHKKLEDKKYEIRKINVDSMDKDMYFDSYLNIIGEDFYYPTEISGKSSMKIDGIDKLFSFYKEIYKLEPL